jgi:hypothetical protein
MSKESTVTKQSRANSTVKGLRTLLGPNDKVRIAGDLYSRDEIIGAFERHKAAIALKRTRWAAYREAVALERELARTANRFWVGLRRWANGTRGDEDLATLGMRRDRKTGPTTLQSKVAGVQKRAKKRAAKSPATWRPSGCSRCP